MTVFINDENLNYRYLCWIDILYYEIIKPIKKFKINKNIELQLVSFVSI